MELKSTSGLTALAQSDEQFEELLVKCDTSDNSLSDVCGLLLVNRGITYAVVKDQLGTYEMIEFYTDSLGFERSEQGAKHLS